MTNWTALVSKLSKAERDVEEWRAGLKDAEQTLGVLQGEAAGALGLKNGTSHKPQSTPVPAVVVVGRRKRRRSQYDSQRSKKVLALLAAKGGFITIDDIVRAQNCARTTIYKTVSTLTKLGRLRRVGNGRYTVGTVQQAA